ncbi:MAG: acetoacetate--CoA ligase [Gammaproteobacteria bacterium]
MADAAWQPPQTRAAASNMQRFLEHVRDEYAPEVANYAGLWRWSTANPERFWPAVWAHCGVVASTTWSRVLDKPEAMPGARWFPGARLNFAENLLRYRDDRSALIFVGENGERRELTYAQLYREVARVAAGLRGAGVVAGDRVAGFLPNRPETVIAMLATTSIGAIWSSCSPDFGANGVLDRFGQIEPRVLFTTDGYFYNGKKIDSLPRISEVVAELPSVRRVVVVPYADPQPDTTAIRDSVAWAGFGDTSVELVFEQLPFDHPVYVMYSSGTTGAPKCIVHGAGGTLLQHLKELALHTDLKRNDRIFYFTTCGWMMWNWLVSSLAVGATVVLYDGSPMFPDADAMWRLLADERVSVFGTSAKYLAAVDKAGVRPGADHDLAALRTILSTGSPLAPESYDWVYREVKADLLLASISGGTDIISCFALGNPLLPVYRGELQCRGLGMAVAVFDDAGRPVVGTKGELVCTQPFPSMPVGFWNDPDGRKYHAAYFDRFPGVWCHGDYAELTEHGGVVIHGRSDAVLNPGGVRIGTAEIYRQVEKLPEILESLAVGQRWGDDVRVVLFVRLRDGVALDDALRQRVRDVIRKNTTPRHVPAKIVAVPDIPRTISGKIVELAVRNAIHGEPVQNTDALANPQALTHFRDLPELHTD